MGPIDRGERGAPVYRGEPAGIAMRQHPDPSKAALCSQATAIDPVPRNGCSRCFLQSNNSQSPTGEVHGAARSPQAGAQVS
jgi:hypothetical protein